MNGTIGLLGASGKVGRGAAELLLGASGYELVLGGRDTDKLRREYGELAESVRLMKVDVFDEKELLAFCGECDVILNCAGPAKRIIDRVALAALRQSVHYVDAAGDEHLYRQLMEHLPELEAKRLSFIVSAGIYPGLSEVLPAYVSQTYFDEVEQLELFFAGAGDFSVNAAYDIVCSIEEGTGMGMAYCLNGEAGKINGPYRQTYTFSAPAGKRDAYPVLSLEFLEMARRNGLRSAWFYNTYPDRAMLAKFMTIKALQQYKTKEQKMTSARMLAAHYAASESPERCANGSDNRSYAQYQLLAKGLKDGRKLELSSQLLYRGDWNQLSGIVAASIAQLVLEDGGAEPGCFFASQGVNPGRVIEALRLHNAAFTCSILEPEGGRHEQQRS